jgi:predicted GH43/DUF377 family glycosyl hydrolase
MTEWTRRLFLRSWAAAAGLGFTGKGRAVGPTAVSALPAFRTPYKCGKLILRKSAIPGSFDEKAVDCPFVFTANGRFYMTYLGFDGVGYQTGLAESKDLLRWERVALVLARDPRDPIIRYNAAMLSILREDALESSAPLKKVNGRYLGAWHAYPGAGYEAGPAVIGLAWSDDLLRWQRTDPILRPEDGAAWERGGLYKPYLVKSSDTYYLFYNAKNKSEGDWLEQIGLATSKDLRTWTRYPGNPIVPVGAPGSWDARFASDPCVVRYGRWWAMYYYGLASNGRARDLLAVSVEPHGRFTKVNEILIDVGPPGAVDDTYAHKPSLISWDGALYHFYCAVQVKGGAESRGISVARSRPWVDSA